MPIQWADSTGRSVELELDASEARNDPAHELRVLGVQRISLIRGPVTARGEVHHHDEIVGVGHEADRSAAAQVGDAGELAQRLRARYRFADLRRRLGLP